MTKVKVEEMRSRHAAVITQAVRNIDVKALVLVNVENQTVSIGSKLDSCRFVVAIRVSGYKPHLLHR